MTHKVEFIMKITRLLLCFGVVLGIILLFSGCWLFKSASGEEDNSSNSNVSAEVTPQLLGAFDEDKIHIFEVGDDGPILRSSLGSPHGRPISMVWLDSEGLAILTVDEVEQEDFENIIPHQYGVYLLRGDDFEPLALPAEGDWDVEPGYDDFVQNPYVDAELLVDQENNLWMRRCIYMEFSYRSCEEQVFMRLLPSVQKSRQPPANRDGMPDLSPPAGYGLETLHVEGERIWHSPVECRSPDGDTSRFYPYSDDDMRSSDYSPFATNWIFHDPPTYLISYGHGSGEGPPYHSLLTACEPEPQTSMVLEEINFGPAGHWAVREFIDFGQDHHWYLYVDAQPRGVVQVPGSDRPLSQVVIAP